MEPEAFWAQSFDRLEDYLQELGAKSKNMATTHRADAVAERRSLTITRIFDAPRKKVFKAWTDATHLAQWWGPKGFTNPVCEVDLRVGGSLRVVMRAPDGTEHPMRGVFHEIVEPERLAFSNIAVDRDDRPLLEGFTTVTFSERSGRTTLTLQTSANPVVAAASAMIDGMEEGWTQSLERLGQHLARP
jgi:uncharacterized protein YndB with AHSA1/START domain